MNTIEAIERAKEINWFGDVGKPTDPTIKTITSWCDWIGPEDSLVTVIHYKQQQYFESLVGDEKEHQNWNDLISSLVGHIKSTVPFEEDGDSWNGPNMAVWHAAWTFALKLLYKDKGLPTPAEITIQMHWFENGRWPCSLIATESAIIENGYVIL